MRQKVFGIGFHKTATTSLAVALYTLGYNVTGYFGVHDPDIADTVYERAFELADRFDAVQDTPWPVLYKELDERYPGSKFILTVRRPERWIRSVTRHFKRYRIAAHEWIYGVENAAGNEGVYVERYERHNREVQAYFQDRPGDLLVMDITRGDGWAKLCPFLGVDEPTFDFPAMNTFGERNRSFGARTIRYLQHRLSLLARHGVSAAFIRDLVHYHYLAFDMLQVTIDAVTAEQFAGEAPGQPGAIRELIAAQLFEEACLFHRLARENPIAEQLQWPEGAATREELNQRWQANVQLMRLLVANLSDEDCNSRVEQAGPSVWEVLVDMVHSGIERRTCINMALSEIGKPVAVPSFVQSLHH